MEAERRRKLAPYRLHIGLRVTQRILWTMLTDLDDEPMLHFRTVAGALRMLDNDEYTHVAYRSGDYTGEISIRYDPMEKPGIMYYVDPRFRVAEEANRGENNRAAAQLWGKWNYRQNADVRQLEGDQVCPTTSSTLESEHKRTTADQERL